MEVRQKSLQSFLESYAKAYDLKNLFIEQQYSMRSYETGLYDIRSDGNLKSVLDILRDMGSDVFQDIYITVPQVNQLKNGVEDLYWIEAQHEKITPIKVTYGENALANRTQHIFSGDRWKGDLVLTYFAIQDRPHTIFLCPGSPRPENTTYSMEEFPWFEKQILDSVATFFFNKNQMIYPEVNLRGQSEKVFEITDFVAPKIPSSYEPVDLIGAIDIYFPYRLSDKDYDFEHLILNELPDSIFGVTDPNNSLKTLPFYDKIANRVLKLDPSKHMANLLTILNDSVDGASSVKVYMPSDLRKTIHLGPVEIISMFRHKQDSLLFPVHWTLKDIVEVKQEAHRSVQRFYKW
ncbi:hypothetical protein AU106_gp269 [Sinorhizobium phage phiM9]|uniref:Uncharacterized protein n=1 Tax=Sinorhizobium phage phiM9 TaxID=1636182 RepID=A0A0F6R653_9CAUD|nr:hypothetical protein AU106_gp269 [Sinorhizobium phage phiM9]AKE44900.1 hypothetical protein Sm_phiM9_273 [Sinorhizobium phage phiM9]